MTFRHSEAEGLKVCTGLAGYGKKERFKMHSSDLFSRKRDNQNQNGQVFEACGSLRSSFRDKAGGMGARTPEPQRFSEHDLFLAHVVFACRFFLMLIVSCLLPSLAGDAGPRI